MHLSFYSFTKTFFMLLNDFVNYNCRILGQVWIGKAI